MERIIVYILLLVLANSCGLNKRPVDEKQYFHFEESYKEIDTLYLKDYIIYNTSKGRDYRLDIKKDDDSLFSILKSSLEKTEINLKHIDSNHNYAKLSFFPDEYLTYEKINKSLIFKSASDFPDKYVIFPVVQIYHNRITNFEATKPGYPKLSCSISLAIFIVKNREVLYYKQARYNKTVSEEDHPYEYEDFNMLIPREKWNGLVDKAMKEFMERLK